MGGVLMAIGQTVPLGAPQRVELNLLDAILARVRALTQRRLLWLESLASSEDRTGPFSGLPDTLRVALLDLDSPLDEARFVQRDARCRELTTRAEACVEAIAAAPENKFNHLIAVLDLTAAEADLLQVCLAAQLDRGIARFFGYLQGDVARMSYPTESLAARLCGLGRASMWSPGGGLARWQVLQALESEPGEDAPLCVDPYTTRFLQGSSEIDPELLDFATYIEPRPPLSGWPVDALRERIEAAIERGYPSRIWLTGQRLSGRRTLAACVAANLGSSLVAVDTTRIGEREWSRVQVRVRRHALLHGCTIAWWGTQVLRACTGGDIRLPVEFGVLEPPGEAPAEPGWREERVEMPRLLSDERNSLWEQFLPVTRTWPEETQRRLSERYTLQVGEIAHVAAQLPETFEDVRRLAREFSRGRLDDLGHLLDCPFNRTDLQLPERLSRVLDEFLFEARDRDPVLGRRAGSSAIPARYRTGRADVRSAWNR